MFFVGVPCQVAGLKAFLGEEYDHLITADILCHGATSPWLFHKHVEYLEKKYKRRLKEIRFRDKSKFPNRIALKYVFNDNHEKYVLGKCEKYFQAFIGGATYRMPCYTCKYAQRDRIGDITLGDYWGIKNVHPDFDNSRGVSLILVNSDKGADLLSKANVHLIKSNLEAASVGNGILNEPSKMDSRRATFYKDLKEKGYEQTIKDNISVKPMIYNCILTNMPQWVIKLLGEIKK